MRGAAAIALAALTAACSHSGLSTRPPPGSAAGVARRACDPFTARFDARVSGPDGRIRLHGILAAAAEGRLRVEASGPSVAAPLLLVAVQDDLSVLLPAERLYYHGGGGPDLLDKVLGMAFRPADLAPLLTGESTSAPGGCEVEVERGLECGEGAEAPTRLTLRCAGGTLVLRLEEIHPLAAREGSDPFAPLAPRAGDRTGDVDDVAAALRSGR